jgi:hypothetical protein
VDFEDFFEVLIMANEKQFEDIGIVHDSLRRRTVSIKISVHPDLYRRFDAIAIRRGFPVVSLAAFALGEFVERVEIEQQMQKMVVLEAARRRVEAVEPASDRRPL